MGPATSRQESHVFCCPRTEPTTDEIYKEIQQNVGRFSLASKRFWADHPDDTQAWLRSCLPRTRDLFQPWCMEILFAAGIRDAVRFSELETLLGISSKTLAAKLRILTEAGFLVRTVHDTQPVSIDYSLTRLGRHTCAMAAPLFSFLHECHVGPIGGTASGTASAPDAPPDRDPSSR